MFLARIVMDVVRIERRESRGAVAELQYPWRYSTSSTVHVGERQRTGG
jgi:hypothetical protein